MAEEAADLVGGFGGKNVLELAGLLFDLRFAVERQAVGEEPLGQAMAANNVGGAQAAARRELDDVVPSPRVPSPKLPSPVDTPAGLRASWHGFTNGL